ncbi:MAG: glycoside hydrolase family 15 protein [Chloroflexota bacterium]|nr:glycoside hydrolase family 15 protein [Chloroflexota bacterium]
MILFSKSVEIINRFQHPSGAYVACPHFDNYQFSWLRDGSFIAYAMDVAGKFESASKFHRWVNDVLIRYAYKVDRIELAIKNGTALTDKDFLFTRYTLDGLEDLEEDGWGNFQYDGYGTWLWALNEHLNLTGDLGLMKEAQDQILLVVKYLTLVWPLPSYDCWEEHPELLHTYSIAAVYGGLKAVLSMVEMGLQNADIAEIKRTLAAMKNFIDSFGTGEQGYLKHISPQHIKNPMRSSGIDSSLLGLAIPFGMYELDNPVMRETIQTIKANLTAPDGGIHRYLGDTYYGGGEWILLTAWLGWVEFLSGDRNLAADRLSWIETQADENGWLPEQVDHHLLAPEFLQVWEQKWGQSATPLLWSHALYIVLYQAMNK